jgi:undecaprenyl-diphosphatase
VNYFEAILLAVVEGLTEFLPVSSTGHMIIAASMMGMEPTAFTKTFMVSIQLGAILAVVLMYLDRFLQSFRFYLILLIGVLPAIVLGAAFDHWIDHAMERIDLVGYGLILGGIVLLFTDRFFNVEGYASAQVTPKNSLIIGLFQCTAIMLPGISRSAATIIGGLTRNLGRKRAAEFSFLLAVPTMCAATGYKLLVYFKDGATLQASEFPILITGNLVAFAVAWFAMRRFVLFLEKHGFVVFGIYRIIAGCIILGLYYAGFQMSLM